METWGELFWDAWIRLRLACRRLYRTYWPPQFKTWQVCTATGIVSIILTLFVLNLPQGEKELQAEHTQPLVPLKSKKTTKPGTPAKLATAEQDPFAAESADDLTSASSDSASELPPSQDVFEDPTEAKPNTRRRQTEIAMNDFSGDETDTQMSEPAAEATQPPAEALTESAEAVLEPAETTEAAPLDDEQAPPARGRQIKIKQVEPDDQPPVAEAESEIALPDTTFTEPTAPVEPVTEAPATTSAPTETESTDEDTDLNSTSRSGVNYGRLGHHEDSEEDRHSVRNVRPAPMKNLPPAKQHTPFVMPIRPRGQYSSLSSREDSEEDRHSVREIRPTRTDNVPTVVARDIVPVTVPAPAAAVEPLTSAEPPSASLPPEPTAPVAVDTVPTEEQFEQPQAPKDDLTPVVPVVETPVTPEEPLEPEAATAVPTDDQFIPEPALPRTSFPDSDAAPSEAGDAELAAPAESMSVDTEIPDPADELSSEPPPVLIAPEEQTPPGRYEYHGPVKSTEGIDHEAHQEEDAFDRPVRKNLPLPLSRPEKTVPDETVGEPIEKTPHVDRAPTETRRHYDEASEELTPPASQATSPRSPAHRTTPRVIITEETARPETEPVNPHVDEDRVIPMDVTRSRGPQPRISVPDRMPPVAPMEPAPSEQVTPASQPDSEFAPAVRRQAPRLVMEITGPKQAPVGTQVVLHFKLQNTGNSPATGIVVTDVLPAGLQHRLSADLEYSVARLMPGETRETNLTVLCVSKGIIVNKAILHADGDVSAEAQIQLEVTDSAVRTETPPRPSQSPLSLKHHGPDRWLVDSTGQFLMTVTNTSTQPLQNVTIIQSYPQGTNLVHATVGHKLDAKNRTVTWTIREFSPGVSYVLETELHSLTSGPATSVAKIKIGDNEIVEDRWTAISSVSMLP